MKTHFRLSKEEFRKRIELVIMRNLLKRANSADDAAEILYQIMDRYWLEGRLSIIEQVFREICVKYRLKSWLICSEGVKDKVETDNKTKWGVEYSKELISAMGCIPYGDEDLE